MDISALLSPDPDSRESTPRSPSTNQPANSSNTQSIGHPQRPPNVPRKSSGLSQQIKFTDKPTIPPQAASQQQRFYTDQRQSLPSIAAYNAAAANAFRPAVPSRMRSADAAKNATTTGMDALAEMASRQRPQTISRLKEHGSSSSTASHGHSLRSPAETMATEVSRQIPPPVIHTFASSVLSAAESKQLVNLARTLQANRLDESAHINYIGLLHKGFSLHLEKTRNAQTYELLRDLRHAREFMDEAIPVGEDLWIEWLTDENMLTRTIDDRISLMELHSRSVAEEPSSSALWRSYGDYMYYLWTCSHKQDDGNSMDWEAADKEVGAQVFTWDLMMGVWESGIRYTKFQVNDSNMVWDRYTEILLKDLARDPAPQKIERVKQIFAERLLQYPHMTWEQTFQNFSHFISTYDNQRYEENMVDITKRSAQVKASYAEREPFETKIQQAIEAGDRSAERAAYAEYLTWELKMKGVFSLARITSLYERATTRFRRDVTFWNDFIGFLISASNSGNKLETLPILVRATRRCPASGELWSHRLLAMEAENMSFQEIEAIKHVATSSLQADREGLEDLLAVYVAWCGFLRRRAMLTPSGEDELDVAEVGITSALENYHKTGEKLLGKEFKGDPQYRLERIQIKVFAQRNDLDAAREVWAALVKQQSDSYDFWYRYYIWAMVMWGREAFRPAADGTLPISAPNEPTAILRQGMKHLDTMDSPEQLVAMFLNHCEQHETVEDYRLAMIEARSANKRIAERRERERQEQWAAYYAQQQIQQSSVAEVASQGTVAEQVVQDNKRKREADSSGESETSSKKNKTDEMDITADESVPIKRDREHTIIAINKLPATATETKIRQFFKGIGEILAIKLVTENGSTRATVEFDTKENARYAQTRVTKPFEGEEIDIEFLVGATLWVTNYPPSADEKYIRNLFRDCGEITEVRFPSLQGNTNRRFCYVQFLDAEDARKATSLNGKVLDGTFHLKALISDPNRKENRHGALIEGREIYVRNVNWKATEDDVKRLFEEHGIVERVRIPVNDKGGSRGVAFVDFEKSEDAKKAIEALHNTPFMSRTINVELSVSKAKRTQTTVLVGSLQSASPEPSANGDAMVIDGSNEDAKAVRLEEQAVKRRTIALLGIPDTVNSARINVLVAPFGTINKITLRPDHGGALVEFVNENSVGAASLALDGTDFDDKKIHTGTIGDLLAHKPELRAGKLSEVKKVKEKTALITQGPVSRPGGRRGGLGKRTGLGFSAPKASQPEENGNGNKVGAKTNADFRSMFMKPKENGEEKKDAI